MDSILNRLQAEPDRYLIPPDPIHLGAFLRGYAWLDRRSRMALAIRDAADSLPGPSGGDIFTRAHLLCRARVGIDAVIEGVRGSVVGDATMASNDLGLAGAALLATVADAIESGRPALVLGESTVVWLANYLHGHVQALSDLEVDECIAGDIDRFQRYIEGVYAAPKESWHAALRSYEGPCERGLVKFAALWRDYVNLPRPSIVAAHVASWTQ